MGRVDRGRPAARGPAASGDPPDRLRRFRPEGRGGDGGPGPEGRRALARRGSAVAGRGQRLVEYAGAGARSARGNGRGGVAVKRILPAAALTVLAVLLAA